MSTTLKPTKPRIDTITYSIEIGSRGETYEIVVRPGDDMYVATVEMPSMELQASEIQAVLDILAMIRRWHCVAPLADKEI